MNKTILILDGDSIAYRCAAAAEERYINVTHKPTGKSKIYKHRTEFKQSMIAKGKEVTDDYLIEDKQDPEPIAYCLNTISNHIKRIADKVQPDEIKIFAGEHFNFRVDLNLPKKYKGNRTDSIRPVHLAEAKRYLHYKYKALEAIGREVDDECSIAAYDALRNGDKPVMYFYEKDQYQLDGVTLLYDNDFMDYELVPELGSLRLEKNAVKGLGLKFLAFQWIWGDPVDCYSAYDLSNVRFGQKSAYNLLKDCSTEKEVLETVIKQFKIFYPDKFEYLDWRGEKQVSDWFGMMQMYYECCRMMRSTDDDLKCIDLFNKYGVQL